MIYSWDYPLWLALLGYSLSGACITLLSALTWFLLSELAENRHAKPNTRRYGPQGAKA
ncbi:MAG: hypothetical protein ACRCS0_00315 [Albidovulum sp.]